MYETLKVFGRSHVEINENLIELLNENNVDKDDIVSICMFKDALFYATVLIKK